MVALDARRTTSGIAAVFEALGAPAADALLVARELVRAEQMGIRSHGLIRTVQYVTEIRAGRTKVGAPIEVVGGHGAVAVVDCGWNLGIVAAHRALEVGLDRVRASGMAAVVTRSCNHVGRLGSYAERAARAGLVCLAAVSVPHVGHYVVPWGGTDGRLGTNPLAYGFPADPDPIVADFATSVIPEGRIRTALANGTQVVPDAMLDADGRPTTDPAAFYGPPKGTLLPFGGPVGHKGYALSLLAELLGGALAGERVDDPERAVNALCLILLDPAAFTLAAPVDELGGKVAEYMRSSAPAPGHERVLVPGQIELELLRDAEDRGVVEVGDAVWDDVQASAASAGVSLEA
jgi:hydroxycarboxylate dehydrogenase B